MAINPVTNLQARRVSDTNIELTWLNAGTYDGVLIEWQMGGEWVFYGDAGSAQTFNVETEPNGCYVFRAIAFFSGQMAEPSYSNVIYTSPAAPVSLSAIRNDDATVSIEIDNAEQQFAEALEIERQLDGDAAWIPVASLDPETMDLNDEPGTGAYWYRARNIIGDLVSAWTYTEQAVSDTVAPGAPSFIAPVDGAIIDYEAETVTAQWRHNSIDGSAQTAAELMYSYDGEEWETVVLTTQSRYEVPVGEPNGDITMMVRTKGASDDFSAWSAARTVYVRKRPAVKVISPTATLPSLPLTFNFNVTDESGSLAYAIIEVETRTGSVSRVVYGTLATFSATELPLENEKEYSYTITAISTSTLSTTIRGKFKTAFSVPARPQLFVTPGNGCVRIVARAGSDVPVPTVRLTVTRKNPDGTTTDLGGTGVSIRMTDYIPPLDVPLEYIVTAYSPTGAQSALTRRVFVDSAGRCYVNWGSGWGNYAFAWRRGEFDTGTENERQLYQVMGRRAPMVFFGEQETVEPSVSAEIPITHIGDIEDAHETTEAWRALEKFKGVACMRLPYEDGFMAYVACDVSISVENEHYKFAELKVKATEVDYGLA